MDTVKIHISIQIETEGVHDTGLTVEQWNALTQAEQAEIAQEMWNDAAGSDNGGIRVITDGAEGI